MRSKSLKISAIIIAIGFILAVATHFLVSVQLKPTVTEQNFPYSVTYKVDGETKTFEGVYTCRFNGFGANGIDPLMRYYDGEYTVNGETTPSRRYTIAEKDGYVLDIITLFDDLYLMGDPQCDPYYTEDVPCLEARDAEGNQYDETEFPTVLDAEIVSWEYPAPIQNTFVFAGFSGLHVVSMGAMLLVGFLTLILCMIFVRKSSGVVYSAIDTIGIILNFLTVIVALPILSFAVALIQAYPTAPDWIYQVYLCIPPIIPFSLAASVSLRRKGFRMSGFFAQFLGGAILVILSVLEYFL